MKKNAYSGYFANHYKVSYSPHDIDTYRRWFSSQWNFIRNRLIFSKNTSVLEIGSAFGGFYSFLPKNIEYTGIEMDKRAAEFANVTFQTNRFIPQSLEEFESKKHFDYIFAFEVLEHITNPRAALVKINSLLKSSGYFVGTSPFPYHKNVWGDETHLYVLHPENWKKLFLEAGFRSIQLIPLTYPPLFWRIHPKLNVRLPFFLGIPNFVSTCLIIASK